MKKNKTNLSLILSLTLTFVFLFLISFSCFSFNNFQNLIIENTSSSSKQSQNNIKPINKTNSTKDATDDNINNNDDTQTENNKIASGSDEEKISEKGKVIYNFASSQIEIGELFDTAKKKFNGDNLQALFDAINKKDYTSVSEMTTLANSNNPNKSIIKGFPASKVRENNDGLDIVVTLCGLTWYVSYLSTDTSGNPIITFWLTNSQKAWYDKPKNAGEYYGFVNNADGTSTLYSAYNKVCSPYHASLDTNGRIVTSNLYSTSYMNSVVLNNGGAYITGANSSKYNGDSSSPNGVFDNNRFRFYIGNYSKTSSSVFAKYTMPEYGLTNYLVAPSQVSWQRQQTATWGITDSGNLYKDYGAVSSYDFVNEATASLSNFKNYTSRQGWGSTSSTVSSPYYYNWVNNYLWLPSYTELGGNLSGIWSPGENQKAFNTDVQQTTKYVGNYVLNPFYDYTPFGGNIWTRSGGKALEFAHNGQIINAFALNIGEYAVRPALHLNIKSAYENSEFTDIWNGVNSNFRASNLNKMFQDITGNSIQTTTNYEELNIQASTIYPNAITFGKNANLIRNSYNTLRGTMNELVIKFGKFNWFPVYLSKDNSSPNANIILTLWLADSEQLYNKGKAGTDGSVKYNVYGSASWNSGSPPYKDTEQNLGTGQFSNNYGNSNIRNLFSTASINTASVFYPYLKTSTNKTAIGDFIVSPKDLNTQDTLNLQKTQSAKSTLGFRYNLPNESYANLINYSNPYKALSLSASTTNYTAWQNDKLWLPSLSEVGLGTNNTISTNSTASNNLRTGGLWGLSTAQRSNTNKTATWLRSGHITDKNLAYTISSDGLDYGYASIDTQNAIRPALHLNLTLACQYAS